MPRFFIRSNSLGIVIAVCFVLAVGGQSFAGWHQYNNDQRAQHAATVGYPRYLVSSDFQDAVMQNWQSEFLQIALYVMFAKWFASRAPRSPSPWMSQPARLIAMRCSGPTSLPTRPGGRGRAAGA